VSIGAQGFAVAVATSGDVFVAGRTQAGLDGNTMISTVGMDCFLARYDSSGNRIFTRHFGGPDFFCSSRDLAFAASGDVYVVAYAAGATGSNYALLAKFDPAGNQTFMKVDGLAGGYTYGYAVAVDAADDVYLVGETDSGVGGGTLTQSGYFLMKYDPSGTLLYARQGVIGSMAAARGVAIDPGGDVFVAGSIGATGTGFLLRFDPAGNLLLTNSTLDLGRIAVDASGSLYGATVTNQVDGRKVLKFEPSELLP
jgi:hypothetical protein